MLSVSEADLRRAAEILRGGGLVAFPTETVYGLGANALDRRAVRRIFEAKERPSTSPLIVHVASAEMLAEVAAEWPETAQALARKFWPGPLTLVVPKSSRIPDEVSAGLNTVGIRMPAHPVALELIRRTALPLAAPSANRFTQISSTTAEHVRQGLGNRVDMILDGGPTEVGIESTVLSVAGPVPVLLRPGKIMRAEIEELIGPVSTAAAPAEGEAHAAPGLHHRHYAPRTPLFIFDQHSTPPPGRGKILQLPSDPGAFAAALYAELHKADREGWDWIAIAQPPDRPEWAAVADRLKRASTARTESVE
jgi:L-threonylcarbamoyladenylate synthase